MRVAPARGFPPSPPRAPPLPPFRALATPIGNCSAGGNGGQTPQPVPSFHSGFGSRCSRLAGAVLGLCWLTSVGWGLGSVARGLLAPSVLCRCALAVRWGSARLRVHPWRVWLLGSVARGLLAPSVRCAVFARSMSVRWGGLFFYAGAKGGVARVAYMKLLVSF